MRENRQAEYIAPKGPQFERPSAPDMLSLSSGYRPPFGFPDSGITGTLPQSAMHTRIGLSSGLNQVSEAGRHTFFCNHRGQLRGSSVFVVRIPALEQGQRPAVPGRILVSSPLRQFAV